MDNTLEKVYYDPANPAAFGGVNKLYDTVKKQATESPSLQDVQKWLCKQDAYTLHAPTFKHFQRNRVLVSGIDKQFQADLVDMSEYAEENDGVHFLLTCIDVFSKHAWVRCLTSKSGENVMKAFENILREGRVPKKLQTDAGKEFYNKPFQRLLASYNIKHFSTFNETKASIVERFNKTLKTRMWRYLTAANSRRYVDVLQSLVHAYNHTRHRSIRMSPSEVCKENERTVFNNLYKSKPKSTVIFKFKVGDTVRISKHRGVFRKGYEQSYTDEFFTIVECLHRIPPVYRLKDQAGDEIQGTFYEKELQLVFIDKNKSFKIEKVLDRKKVGRKNHVLVKWLGWPDKFNSWIPEKDLVET